MRFGGTRYWLYLTRRALVLACVALAVAATAATAAPRYAVPAGGQTAGTCGAGSECTLPYALSTAVSGDTLYIASGTYVLTAPINESNVDVHGQGATKPRLVGGGGFNAATLTITGNGSVRDVRVESSSAYPALNIDGTAERVEAYASAGNAVALTAGNTMSTSLAHTSAAGATAVRISGSLLTTTTVAHSTIVATGTGSSGLDASGLLASPSVSSSIVNGASTDITGDLLASVSVRDSAYRTGLSAYVSSAGGNRNVAATFANAAALDFQQSASSPTVNTGSNSDGATIDIDGRPRTIAEGTDIGAYELPIPPTVTTGAASNVTGTAARIAATINPRGSMTSYQIKYGKTSPPAGSSGSTPLDAGTVNLSPNTDLDNLTPASTYYYRVVASNEWGETEGAIFSFNTPSIAPVSITDAATLVTPTSARLNARVNPGGAATSANFEWGETTAYGTSTTVQSLGSGTSTLSVNQPLTGLTPNKTYYYRVSAVNSNGTISGLQGSFTTPARAPITSVSAPTGLMTDQVTLHGSVDPGGADTTWQFDYGVGAYDQTASGTTLSGTTSQGANKTVTALLPGTTYQYRLVAQNSAGTTTSTGTFATQVAMPSVETGDSAFITARSALVGGQVNPGGAPATYFVEYGTTGALGQSTAAVNVPDGTDDVDAMRTLSGLEPGTVYHYRFVATNSAGTARGNQQTFTTAVALPGVATDRASGVTQTGALLRGAVNPGGGATTWSFEYGRTAAYGHTTSVRTATAGNDDEIVEAAVEGLEPGATYHFRLVARNAAGETVGEDATFTAGAPDPDDLDEPVDDVPTDGDGDGPTQADGLAAPTATPPVGRAANAAPASGTVEVKLPGGDEFVPLTEGASIPMGSVVDATDGQVKITSAADTKGRTQTASFGGSQFKITQKKAAKPITDITLVGGDFSNCFPRALAKDAELFAAGRRKWSRRRLWGNGHGRFRTRGRHGTATVRGTHWLTEDRCDGTLVRVRRGLVEVRDLERRRTVMVSAGEQYFAKSLRAQKARRKSKR